MTFLIHQPEDTLQAGVRAARELLSREAGEMERRVAESWRNRNRKEKNEPRCES